MARQIFGDQGRVVRKPVNANPGLKVNRNSSFSLLMLFCSLSRLFKLKTEGQTKLKENLTEKVPTSNQNSR